MSTSTIHIASKALQLFSKHRNLDWHLAFPCLHQQINYPELIWDADSIFAQSFANDNDIIQFIKHVTFRIDDLGNFHVIGEVNNTAFDPQTNIVITTILSNTTNNSIVGNHSAFSSIGTLETW